MNLQSVINLIGVSLQNISIFDSHLLDRKVREECVSHRLAYYIESIYEVIVYDEMLYSVDLEYNKNLGNYDKEIVGLNGGKISIRPDIIIHQRPNNDNNLIAIEAKHGSSDKHDIHKLKMLLEVPFRYSYSIGVNYLPQKENFRVKIFWKNNEFQNITLLIPKINGDQVDGLSFINRQLYISTDLLNQ